jgi:putative ABC transport system ATP-binding protein
MIDTVSTETGAPRLVCTDLRKTYRGGDGGVSALDGVSCALDPGDFCVVCGPSGCGKTTLLLTLGGLLAPDSGTVRIGDIDLYKLAPDDRSRMRAHTIGFVFQQFHLIPYLSVLENVLAPSIALRRDDVEDRARDLIARFNLRGRIDHLPSELSTGERQRTALARALVNNPALILADEPTGNLDPDNGEEVLAALDDFSHAGGTVLMVTHNPEAAARAQWMLTMNDGGISASNRTGSHS